MTARGFSALILLVLLPAVVVLTPLAYASPPDPVWVSGIFDNDDHDDVIVLVTSAGATIDPFPLEREWTAPTPEVASQGEEPSALSHTLSCGTPRAPPAA